MNWKGLVAYSQPRLSEKLAQYSSRAIVALKLPKASEELERVTPRCHLSCNRQHSSERMLATSNVEYEQRSVQTQVLAVEAAADVVAIL